MQDLTAHYNILFNANEILRQKQDDYALAFIDSYGDILNVYPDTTVQGAKSDKDLDLAMVKANRVINEKDQSNYIGDAYLVLGKANYLGGNYFNAAEYFSYVIRSFPKEVKLVQEAATWKVRSLLYLKKYGEAKLTLDTAFMTANPKKHIPAALYAAKLQYDIDVQDYKDGEAMAKMAIEYSGDTKQKIRWTFILGQLQELNHENNLAILSYIKVGKSNSAFEMAFNANLNRIRIEDERNGVKLSRIDRLLALLQNQNNLDFKDQIYYQVGEIYALDKDVNNALKYYKLSVRASRTNQNQKGLSYLRIADIDFNIKADYVNAKKYYDSTLTSLPLNYPGYQTIQKKNNNLKILVDRLQIIGREDTLQMLAKLDEKTRNAKIDAMVAAQILQQQQQAASALANANSGFGANGNGVSKPTGSNFYFYNATAISQGLAEFKRVWGNRKLEDDWRRSNRSTTNITANAQSPGSADPDALLADKRKTRTDVAGGTYRQQIVQSLPLTPVLLEQSNARMYAAYLDIANFYRDILDDKPEAIKTYEVILTRFPTDTNKAYIYYNLYRLYSVTNVEISNTYKGKLLKEYPETPFAKVIIDPDYAKTLNDKDAAFNNAYNKVYDLYAQKKYTQAIKKTDTLMKQYPAHKQVVQLQYLRVISEGHQEGLPPFREQLQQIADNFPTDGLITPLVKKHLAYIDANKNEIGKQPYALMNNDTTEVMFIPPIANQKKTPYRRPYVPEPEVKKTAEKPIAKVVQPQPQPAKGKTTNEVVVITLPPKAVSEPPAVFTKRDSTNYYFVINVSTGTVDLSSSRFGIGQFNRANYAANTIKHQLKNAGDDNQLIYIGRFYSLAEVKKYARDIIPLMPQIMKVPKDKYTFFIITQENLDKVVDKKQLDSYFDYYQKNY